MLADDHPKEAKHRDASAMISTKLFHFTFLGKASQYSKKCRDFGVITKRFVAATTKFNRKNRSQRLLTLIEMEEKFQLLKPGDKVLDLGAAPGSWSEFLALKTNSTRSDPTSPAGLVIAVDIREFSDIDGVITLPCTDFLKQSSQEKILNCLGKGEKFDFIFSDLILMTGNEASDQVRLKKLVYCAMLFSVKNLKTNGGVLIKTWEGAGLREFQSIMKKFFGSVKFFDLNIGGAVLEKFFVGTKFRGLKGMRSG